MENIQLQADEVILYEGGATSSTYKGNLKITLTSRRIIIEKEIGLFKKTLELVDTFNLDTIKVYNEIPQIKQKGSAVDIQADKQNVSLVFSGMFEAAKFSGKAMDAATGTTLAKRGAQKVKDAFDIVDDTLGLDTRGTIKGILENGVKGTIFNGIGKKK